MPMETTGSSAIAHPSREPDAGARFSTIGMPALSWISCCGRSWASEVVALTRAAARMLTRKQADGERLRV